MMAGLIEMRASPQDLRLLAGNGMIPNKQASSFSPKIIGDGPDRQRVSFALKLASLIETEDRRIDGFIERLGAVNKLPSEIWLETVCQITDILDRDARSKPDP
jgi:hypothetical protein